MYVAVVAVDPTITSVVGVAVVDAILVGIDRRHTRSDNTVDIIVDVVVSGVLKPGGSISSSIKWIRVGWGVVGVGIEFLLYWNVWDVLLIGQVVLLYVRRHHVKFS